MSEDKTFTQADVDRMISERVNALKSQHAEALKVVRDELTAATNRWKEAEPKLSRVAELEADIAKRDRAAMFSAVGITDDKQIERVAKWYDLVREDFPEAERPDLATWLKDHAPNDPTVGALFKAPAAQTQVQKPATGPQMPNTGTNAKPIPAPAPKLTEADIKQAVESKMAEARKHPVGSKEYDRFVREARDVLRTGGAAA